MGRLFQAEILLGKGQRAAAAGDTAAALAAYDRALAICPDYAPAHLYKAIGLSTAQAHGPAAASARRAVALDPQRPAYHLVEGMVAYDAGDPGFARTSFEEACRLAPTNRLAAAYSRLAKIRRRLPSPDPDDLAEVEALLPSTNPAFQARWLILCESQLGNCRPRAHTLVEQMIGAAYLAPAEAGQASRVQRWSFKMGRFGAALGAVTAARRAALALERQAQTQLAAGDAHGALKSLAEALSLRPGAEALLDKYLDLCLYCGTYEPILESVGTPAQIEALESLTGREADAQLHLMVLLGVVRFHQGAFDRADGLLRVAAEGDPLDFLAPYLLGVCRLAGGAPETARHWFQRAAAVVNPDIAKRRLEEWRRCLARPSPAGLAV